MFIYKKWVKYLIFIGIFSLSLVIMINYVVNPYGIYKSNFLNIDKTQQHEKIRLVKALKIKEYDMKSIILGTSRATYGFNPKHSYFVQPCYNAALPGGTMYENKLILEQAIKYNKSLKDVFLVLDYRMFNSIEQQRIGDFNTYFENDFLRYTLLLSKDQLVDSFKTYTGTDETIKIYLDNGFRIENKNIKKRKNKYLSMLKDESTYYEGYTSEYIYKTTGRNSFDDFNDLLKIVSKNNLNLTIVFGPSHIRLWESFDYHVNYDTILKFKKDIVVSVSNLNQSDHSRIVIYDFAVYNQYTNEPIPNDNTSMKYHIDTNHYKENLGNLILDYLNNKNQDTLLGNRIDIHNIDLHLQKLRNDRQIYIDTKKYKEEMNQYIVNKTK